MARGIIIALGAVGVAAGTTAFVAIPDSATTVARLCRDAGLCDHPPPPPESFDLIVDVSEGSSGSRENVQRTIGLILERMSTSPGSALRIIAQGARVVDATVVSTAQATAPTRTNRKARVAHAKRFIATTHELLMEAMEPIIATRPALRNSPIAETINWTALLSPPSGLLPTVPRHIIVISDAREVSKEFGDFECGVLPTSAKFIDRLRTHDVLTPRSLEGVRLHFTFTQPRSVARRACPPMTIARINDIRGLWVAAANYAGVAEVTFETDVIAFNANVKEDQP